MAFRINSFRARLALGGLSAVLAAAAGWSASPSPNSRAAEARQSDIVRPRRIVSLNLCADQLLLALADRDQIAGLTRNAADPEMSAAATAARGLPRLGGSAEEVLAARPDLIVGMPVRGSSAMAALKKQNYPTVDLDFVTDYAGIKRSVRVIARAVGHPRRGEALIARMDRDLAGLPRRSRHPVAAYYQRRGFLTGAGTLVDDLMTRAGVVNLASRLGKPALSQVSLEELVAARPDYLIVESATERVADQGTAMLHHSALSGIARISMPQAWTVCGGPAYVKAVRAISEAVAAR